LIKSIKAATEGYLVSLKQIKLRVIKIFVVNTI